MWEADSSASYKKSKMGKGRKAGGQDWRPTGPSFFSPDMTAKTCDMLMFGQRCGHYCCMKQKRMNDLGGRGKQQAHTIVMTKELRL